MVYSDKCSSWQAKSERSIRMMRMFMIRQDLDLNLRRNRQREMSASAVGALTRILRYSVYVY